MLTLLIHDTVVFNVPSMPITTPNSATIQLSCTKLQALSKINMATLELQIASKTNRERSFKSYQNSIVCNGKPIDLKYTNLSQNTQYFIVSLWIFRGVAHNCNVTQFTTSKYQNSQTNESTLIFFSMKISAFTASDSPANNKGKLVGKVVGSVFGILFFLVVICVTVCCVVLYFCRRIGYDCL